MRIVELKAENVKRIKAVRIKPDGSLVEITGRNGQGKTSVLDSIMYALGGKADATQPIRNGQKSASVEVDLGELKVRKRWTDKGEYLDVFAADGKSKMQSPQAVLDKLVGELTFDPLAFSKMAAKQQSETLAKLAGVDLAAFAAKKKTLESERVIVGRDLKNAQGQLAGMEVVNAPDDEIDVATLAAKHREISDKNAANKREREQINTIAKIMEQAAKDADELKRKYDAKAQELKNFTKMLADQETKCRDLVDGTVGDLAEQIQSATATNRAVAAKRIRKAKSEETDKLKTEYDAFTTKIRDLESSLSESIGKAQLPVDGLSFAADGITFNEIPFEQASSAEQLRVSAAIGIALNPKLRVMLIRDGSLLDADSLASIGQMADKADAQIWIERVENSQEPGSIWISDGEVSP